MFANWIGLDMCVTLLNHTHVFEWYLYLGGYKIDTCYYEIGLCARNIDTIVSSLVNTPV